MSIFLDIPKKGALPFTYDWWDRNIYAGCVEKLPDNTYIMAYTGYNLPEGTSYGPCIAYSDDLVNWTKPNLGQITVQGSADNNVVIVYDRAVVSWFGYIDGTLTITLRNANTTSNLIYTSADGVTWNFVDNAFTNATHGQHVEGKALLKVGSNYRFYYTQGHFDTPDQRSVGYYDAPALTGPWTDRGLVSEWTSGSESNQYYDANFWEYNDLLYACVPDYDGVTDLLGPAVLYVSDDDAATWTRLGTIVTFGAEESFDDRLISVGRPELVGDQFVFIYAGSPRLHFSANRPTTFGYATIPIPRSGGSKLSRSGEVEALAVAEGFAGASGDVFIAGTRYSSDGRMYVTTDTPSVTRQMIAGILHTDTGIRYIATTGGAVAGPEGFAVSSAGVQLVTATPSSPLYIKGVGRNSNGAMNYVPQ